MNENDVLTSKEIDEAGNSEVPEIYRSLSGNTSASRLMNFNTRSNLPILVEVLEGSVVIDNNGSVNTIIPYTRQIHKNIPLVLGLVRRGDGSVVKVPFGVGNSANGVTLGTVTTNTVQLISESFPAQKGTLYYKLRVYNVNI